MLARLGSEFDLETGKLAAQACALSLLAELSDAVGGLGTNVHWGAPRNPWDIHQHRTPGGSSSGAGVSLVGGTASLALGTDTAGSAAGG